MRIAECLQRRFEYTETNLEHVSYVKFEADFGDAYMSLELGYDLFTYTGVSEQFDLTSWTLSPGDTIMQLHVSQSIYDAPTLEKVVSVWNAAKKLFPLVGAACEKDNPSYVISASEYSVSRILKHFIPSFVPVENLDSTRKLARFIQSRRPNREMHYFPVMVTPSADFIRDTQRFASVG